MVPCLRARFGSRAVLSEHPPLQRRTGPWSIAAADFNEDGHLDLAVANNFGDSFSLLLGNGLGGFVESDAVPTGDGPSAIVSEDFNEDGHADLALAHASSDDIAVLLGDGHGGFSAAPQLLSAPDPRALVCADFDEDGHLDLVAANLVTDNISLGAPLERYESIVVTEDGRRVTGFVLPEKGGETALRIETSGGDTCQRLTGMVRTGFAEVIAELSAMATDHSVAISLKNRLVAPSFSSM